MTVRRHSWLGEIDHPPFLGLGRSGIKPNNPGKEIDVVPGEGKDLAR
jgi:hypothetical protein